MFPTGKNRSGLEILLDVLENARGGAERTHLMHQANLGYQRFKRSLSFLSDKKLLKITETSSGNQCLTTEKGLKLIESFKLLEEEESQRS